MILSTYVPNNRFISSEWETVESEWETVESEWGIVVSEWETVESATTVVSELSLWILKSSSAFFVLLIISVRRFY